MIETMNRTCEALCRMQRVSVAVVVPLCAVLLMMLTMRSPLSQAILCAIYE